MKTADLTIVILSYNVEKLLIACIESVLASQTTSDNWQIVVVDNVSLDGSVTSIKKHFPKVKVIENPQNFGFGKGNNVALRKVTTEYTLLLNPDTVVYPGTIQTVLDYIRNHPNVGAATCRVELPDGTLDYSCHRRFPDPWNSFVYFFSGLGKKSSYAYTNIPPGIHEIDALCGAFAMIRTEVGKKLNWFDEDYWWNGEDLDLCYRIKQLAKKIVFIPDVKITHYKGSSSGLQKTASVSVPKSIKIKTTLSGLTAMRLFYDKHLKNKYPWIFNQFIYLGMFVLKTIRVIKIKLGFGL
jgi:GT2 family glycosyltransferase